MAEIVLGLGTPHSPQLSTPPELWHEHGARDQGNPGLHATDGNVYTYDQLMDMADPALSKEIGPEQFKTRHAASQQAIATLGATLEQANADVVLIMGNDQLELFHEDNMPALLVYWGETFPNVPPKYDDATPASSRVSSWGWAADTEIEYPVASDLGRHIIEYLTDHEFDTAHANRV